MSCPVLEYYENDDDKPEVYKLLKDLSLYNLYDGLDQTLSSKPHALTCDQKCNAYLQKGETEELELLELCKSVCNVILTTEDIDIFCSNPVCNRSCLYRNLWLYNHVLNNIKSKINISNFYRAMELIQKSDISVLNKCFVKNLNIECNVLNNVKFIYEFLRLYDDIKNKISGEYELNVELYCKHIKENFQFYNKIKKECTNNKDCKYYEELMNFKDQFSEDEVLKFICENCRHEKIQCKGDSTLSKDIPCLKERENSFMIIKQEGDSNNVIKILYMSLISFSSVMGIFSMFYKFTPLGSWLRTKIGKEKSIQKHMNKENYDNLEYLHKIDSTYSDNKIYNVKYN